MNIDIKTITNPSLTCTSTVTKATLQHSYPKVLPSSQSEISIKMPADSLINTDTTVDLSRTSNEKNIDVSHLLRYVHTETLRRNYQQLEDAKLESETIATSKKDLESCTDIRYCANDNNNKNYYTRLSSIPRQVDSLFRASETVLCYFLWFVLAAISDIYQPSYIAFSIYHIIFALYFFTPDVDKVNPKTIMRFTLFLIDGFYSAMWVGFVFKVVYEGKTYGDEDNILVVLHKEFAAHMLKRLRYNPGFSYRTNVKDFLR